jgi:hypothetical protein
MKGRNEMIKKSPFINQAPMYIVRWFEFGNEQSRVEYSRRDVEWLLGELRKRCISALVETI